jgi:predicted ATP-grasp superfamily ATP-dependent carboligase
MSEPIFSLVDLNVSVPKGLRLIAGLNGFTDAGLSIAQTAEHIFSNFETELIIRFDNEALLDYRSRRPIMLFEKDHISSYEPAILGIYLVHDEAGQPFLYLHGYEPDFKWERFADAILSLIEDFAVREFIWVHSIPFPMPHTRPVGITVSGNRSDLIDKYSEWKPDTQVPGNVLHLLEYRLTSLGLSSVGFVLLIPHYIADSEYPKAALTAFELISAASGLVFPTDSLREQNDNFERKLNQQVAENEDLARMVANLEQGYRNERVGPIQASVRRPEQSVPSADDIAAQLEDYLANRRINNAEDES